MQHQLNVQNIQAMPCMQVHARLQHVVMQKYEGKKMRLVEPSMIMSSMPAKRTLKFIEVIVEEEVDGKYRPEKFNLQQTWMLQSPSTYRDAYGFRRALMGDNYNNPCSDLSVENFPSLVFVEYPSEIGCASGKDMNKYKPFMDAEDVVKFLLSEFAKRGQHDEIFEDDTKRKRQKSDGDKRHEVEYSTDDREWQDEKCTRGPTGKSAWTGPPELVKIIEASGVSRVNSQAATGRVKSRAQATTAQSMFMQRCVARMDIVQDCFSKRVSTASDDCSAMKRKRKLELADTAMHNLASILMEANVMFYSEAMEENDE
jgi:hypothetical protein